MTATHRFFVLQVPIVNVLGEVHPRHLVVRAANPTKALIAGGVGPTEMSFVPQSHTRGVLRIYERGAKPTDTLALPSTAAPVTVWEYVPAPGEAADPARSGFSFDGVVSCTKGTPLVRISDLAQVKAATAKETSAPTPATPPTAAAVDAAFEQLYEPGETSAKPKTPVGVLRVAEDCVQRAQSSLGPSASVAAVEDEALRLMVAHYRTGPLAKAVTVPTKAVASATAPSPEPSTREYKMAIDPDLKSDITAGTLIAGGRSAIKFGKDLFRSKVLPNIDHVAARAVVSYVLDSQVGTIGMKLAIGYGVPLLAPRLPEGPAKMYARQLAMHMRQDGYADVVGEAIDVVLDPLTAYLTAEAAKYPGLTSTTPALEDPADRGAGTAPVRADAKVVAG